MANPNTMRKLRDGAYHKEIFKDEKNVKEEIVIRDGKTTSSTTKKADLKFSPFENLKL
jgi:hypothetical protein